MNLIALVTIYVCAATVSSNVSYILGLVLIFNSLVFERMSNPSFIQFLTFLPAVFRDQS